MVVVVVVVIRLLWLSSFKQLGSVRIMEMVWCGVVDGVDGRWPMVDGVDGVVNYLGT